MILQKVKKEDSNPLHTSVLLEEVILYLDPKPNQNFIDGTIGAGGHAEKILERTGPDGKLIGFDMNPESIKQSKKRLKKYKNRVLLYQSNYSKIERVTYEQSRIHKISGILLDLGISSFQLKSKGGGFSFKIDGPLDMRFGGPDQELTAEEIINKWPEKELVNILQNYGEERHSRLIAREIVRSRKTKHIAKTNELVEIIEKVYSNKPKPRRIHPATKTFQALRIAVNDELNSLRRMLPQALNILSPKGRIAIISFHSLEDRIVKQFFRQESKGCLCPPEFPVCRCAHKKQLTILTKKVIMPSLEETKQNYRARSAKLRVAEKI
ncbi:16S rRNA (cytosine(1402)-N(4))-methyltransferase RsmH [Patescibacteria group bacterium]|nr:16S rRNA (cytosine(1402)-N(4))-methyltransferase RsmH [Patescibacteria group bacterium]